MTQSNLAPAPFDAEKARREFPILNTKIGNHPLVYLDSAASAQKPKVVTEAIQTSHNSAYSNVHRGVHHLSEKATTAFEAARERCRAFLGAEKAHECIFTRNATEAFNLIAHSLGRTRFRAGDEIILSLMEHHSNIVPWLMLRDEVGIKIKVVPILEDGQLDMLAFEDMLSEKTRLVALTHMSNTLGTVNPIKEIAAKAHSAGALVLFDGSQGAVHKEVDVQNIDADFYICTGHKLYGPSGIGVLYGRESLLEDMPPFLGGGEMISSVSFERVTYAELPHKFEAGTPAITEAVALHAALDFLCSFDRAAIHAHEAALTQKITLDLLERGCIVHGQAPDKGSVVTFSHPEIHAHDIGSLLDHMGVAVRVGQHCAEPLMDHLGVPATARASFGLYNTMDDVSRFTAALDKTLSFF